MTGIRVSKRNLFTFFILCTGYESRMWREGGRRREKVSGRKKKEENCPPGVFTAFSSSSSASSSCFFCDASWCDDTTLRLKLAGCMWHSIFVTVLFYIKNGFVRLYITYNYVFFGYLWKFLWYYGKMKEKGNVFVYIL